MKHSSYYSHCPLPLTHSSNDDIMNDQYIHIYKKVYNASIHSHYSISMAFFDFSLAILFLVNILKSDLAMAGSWEWDPFHVVDNITWKKNFLLFSLFLILSFFSITISFVNTLNVAVQVRFNRFSAIHMISFWPLVFFPQAVFWYSFPFFFVLFTFTSCITGIFRLFLMSTQTVLSLLPNLEIFITRHHHHQHQQQTNNNELPAAAAAPVALPDRLDIEVV